MKSSLKPLMFSVALLAGVVPAQQVMAQTTSLTPLPDPATPTAPTAPSAAKESYDEKAIEQIMKIVDLSRSIGGGILQLFTSVQAQEKLLTEIRDANLGTKTFPLNNTGADVAGREGGTSFNDMVAGALAGAPVGPTDFIDALNLFRPTYSLDKAFALVNDESPTKKLIANLAGIGTVAASTGEDSYKRANASSARLDGYIVAIQSSQDLKTSMDINTRVQIEAVHQLNEILRTQSSIAVSIGAYYMLMGAEASEPDGMEKLKDFNR